MDTETDFYERFHYLPGSTVAEKKKSLNTFIGQLDNKMPQNTINVLITKLKPKTKLEAVFRVDLLLHYKIYDEVMELLKSGDSLYISLILKDWSFFRKTFPSMTGSTFVEDVLPHTSFSSRMKIINRVSKNLLNEEKADEFFRAIEERYGITSAAVMLPYCSLGVIKETVIKYNLVLNQRQLMTILKRNSEFLEFYFERLQGHGKTNILKVLLKENEELFWKLHEKHGYRLSFGKRLSKRALRDREHLLGYLSNCRIDFKKRCVYQKLRSNPEAFKEFVLQAMPDHVTIRIGVEYIFTIGSIGTYIYPHISVGKRYQFINGFCKEKFGFDLHDRPELITENTLRLMPEQIRENVLAAKIEENDELAYLHRPEISVPLIMDKIRHCSDMFKRVTYLKMLYKSCEFHKHEQSLLEILKYNEARHRNDVVALETFFDRLASWNDIEDLSVEYWTYIDCIEKLLVLKDRHVDELFFLEKRIGHLIKNKLDTSEQMLNYFELLRKNRYDYIFEKIPKYRRWCILEMKTYIDKIEDGDEKERLLARYLVWVFHHNMSTSSKDDIPILDYLPLLLTLFKKCRYMSLTQIITFYVQRYYDQFNPIVWEYPHVFFPESTLFSWYLSHHKDELLDNIELIFQIENVRKNQQFIRYLSLYAFRNIPERLIQLSIETVQSNDCVGNRITALNILSWLDQEEFMRVSASFEPYPEGKVRITDPPERIKLQEALLDNMKHSRRPAALLETLMKYCVGDYLRYALRPLYNIVSRVPEREAVAFLNRLHRSAVSVRKHVIHLGKLIYPFDEFCRFLMEESMAEKNASLKTILFQKALEYAAVTPTSRTWELIQATIHGIDKDDAEAHDLLFKIAEVPERYRAAYIAEAYGILDASKVTKIRRKRIDFIDRIPRDVIDQLDCDLMLTFMGEIMYDKGTGRYVHARDKWIDFVFYSSGEKQNVLFDFALSKLEEYNKSHANNVIDDNQLNFMKNLCRSFLQFSTNYSMVHKFTALWFATFLPEIDIDSHCQVLFVHAYAECGYNLQSFAVKTVQLMKVFLASTDDSLFEFFVINLKQFLKRINCVDACAFVEAILAVEDSIRVCLTSIRLLPLQAPWNAGQAVRCRSVIEKLKGRSELCVKIYFRKFLRDFERRVAQKI